MNQSLSGLLDGMRRALREDVLPEVRSAHARGQMAGVIDILNKLERMVVWSPDVLREELAIIVEGFRAIDEHLRLCGYESPPPECDLKLSSAASQSELESRVAAGRRRLAGITDWLFDPANPLSAEQRKTIDALLRETIRDAMAPERRLVPRADYSGMAGADH